MLVAHRGASSARAENTMGAFEAAISMGAAGIEFDVHSTLEGALVVHHDYLLDRTTTGHGLVHEQTSAYVRSLDAGRWFSEADAGQVVPLLSEVLQLRGVEFELELKGLTVDHMRDVVTAVRQFGALARTEFTSWNVPMLLRLKSENPEARIALFSRRREAWMPDALFERTVLAPALCAPFDVVHVYAADITSQVVEAIHTRGLIAHANDAATRSEVEAAFAAGADRVSSNDVEMMTDVVTSTAPSAAGR